MSENSLTNKNMTTDIEALKLCIGDYAEANLPKAPNNKYVCPFCGSGTGTHGTSALNIYEDSFYCFACNTHGDLFDLIQKHEGLSYFTEAYNKAIELYPQIASGQIKPTPKPKHEPIDDEKLKEIQKRLLTDLINWNGDVKETDYWQSRGITDETVAHFYLGYDKQRNRVTIPYNTKGNYYTARNLDAGADGNKPRYYKPPHELVGKEPLFNEEAIDNKKPLFVTEGALDAISLYEAFNGVSSVCLGGLSYDKLLTVLARKRFKNVVILSLDNDEAGKSATSKLKEALKDAKIKYIEANYNYSKYDSVDRLKDANDLLKANKNQLTKDIMDNIKRAEEVLNDPIVRDKNVYHMNLSKYLKAGQFEKDLNYFKKYKDRKTGFKNLDQHFTMYAGLAVLGGSASLGKSTFAINWADNLARKGEKVLFFALEQQPIELITKLIARSALLKYPNSRITNTTIKNGGNAEVDEVIKELMNDYEPIAKNIEIVKCDFSITAEEIKAYIEEYIEREHVKPVVFIDYLQLISTPDSYKGDARASVDHVVKVLKTAQLENELFMLIISNFNRESYKNKVSYESFKESGLIEYTADYTLGLQLAVMEGERMAKAKTPSEKSTIIHEANSQNPKEVELVCLKNRNGKQYFNVFFKYYMENDAFIEDFNSQYDPKNASTRDGKISYQGLKLTVR